MPQVYSWTKPHFRLTQLQPIYQGMGMGSLVGDCSCDIIYTLKGVAFRLSLSVCYMFSLVVVSLCPLLFTRLCIRCKDACDLMLQHLILLLGYDNFQMLYEHVILLCHDLFFSRLTVDHSFWLSVHFSVQSGFATFQLYVMLIEVLTASFWFWQHHIYWCRLVKNIGWANQNIGGGKRW